MMVCLCMSYRVHEYMWLAHTWLIDIDVSAIVGKLSNYFGLSFQISKMGRHRCLPHRILVRIKWD